MATTKKYGLTGIGTSVELGKDGVIIKSDSGALLVRNNADDAYVKIKALEATADEDVVVLSQLDDAIDGLDFTKIRDAAGTTYIDTDETAGELTASAGGTEVWNATSSGLQIGSSGARVTTILDEDTMVSDSATALATQQSIKAYVDNAISGLASGLEYKGTFDASAGDYTALNNASQGDFYKVGTAGTISGIDYQVGDMIIINKDVTGTPTNADIDKIDNTESPDLLRASDLTDAQIFVGDGSSTPNAVSVSGDVTLTNTGSITIDAGAVTVGKIEGLADGEIIIGVDGTAANNAKVTISGDASLANDGTLTIAADAVTYDKMQDTSASGVVLGRVTAGAGTVEEITIDTDLSSVSASDDTLASAKAIKAYVDDQVSDVDSNVESKRVSLAFGSASNLAIGTAVPADAIVTKAIINVSTAFNGSNPDLTIGDSTDNDAVATSQEINLKKVGLYVCDCAVLYSSSTQINAYYTADSSSAGAATILLEYHTA